MNGRLLEIERDIPGTGKRMVTQQAVTEDIPAELERIRALGFARFAPGVSEWSMLRDGDRALVADGEAYEYRAGSWVPIYAQTTGKAEQGHPF